MAKQGKLLRKVLAGAADQNIPFGDLRRLLLQYGFSERIRGDHHIYVKDGIEEILNLQPAGSLAKPYQVKQVRGIILRYKLAHESDE